MKQQDTLDPAEPVTGTPSSTPRKHRWKGGDRCTVCGLNREGAGAYGSMRYYRDGEAGRAYNAGSCTIPPPVVLHVKIPDAWNSGPDIRKCTSCSVRLWLATDGIWTDSRAVWENPPAGYVSCQKPAVQP